MTKTDRIFAVMSLVAMVFLMIMINLTTPSDIGPLGVLVFFTLVYLVCFGVIMGVCRILFQIVGRLKNKKTTSGRKSYYYSSVLAFVPIVLIFMRSFGELNFLEVVLVGFFAIVGCFYISKKT